MSNPLPEKSLGDHLHFAARTLVSAIPTIGGPALELLNTVIAPPLERRRNVWLNGLAERIQALEEEGRLDLKDLANNEAFISAVMQATMGALRNHQQEKLEGLRNAVLNSALVRFPEDAKREMFLAFVDQFTVWHLRVLRDLFNPGSRENQHSAIKTRINDIAEMAMERVLGLRGQQPLAETVVEDLCRKGLLFWAGERVATFIPQDARQVTQLGAEFLQFISEPQQVR